VLKVCARDGDRFDQQQAAGQHVLFGRHIRTPHPETDEDWTCRLQRLSHLEAVLEGWVVALRVCREHVLVVQELGQ
jgi:hypothetical protein